MDTHHDLQFGQNEQITNKGTCVLDSENFKGSNLDSKDNVYGNGVSGVDIIRSSTLSRTFGGEINEAEGLDHNKDLLGSCKQHENVTVLKNETNQGDCLVFQKAPSVADKNVIIDDVMQLLEFSEDEKNSVPSDCVSMFTNIFGPSDDVYESEMQCTDNGFAEGNLDKSISCENKTLSPNVIENNTVDEHVQDDNKNFVSGDIVWVMMKTKLWWPGIISDPSSKPPKKFISKDCFFIKLFFNPSSIWASSSELKEFTSYFDEMVKQNESRSFYTAVEKAINEIGCHVMKELTCSCFQKPCPQKNLQLKAFTLSGFQPIKFLSFIKHLAIDSSVSKKIQVTVTRNCLSSFYRSLGHPQLQIHQLNPNRNSSRNRSRNVLNSDTNQTEDCKNLKKGSEVDITKTIKKLSLKEIIFNLRWAATDLSICNERGHFGSLKKFFSCFRKFVYFKHEHGLSGISPEVEHSKDGPKDCTNLENPKKKRQRKTNINQESKDNSSAVNEGHRLEFDPIKGKKITARERKKAANAASVISEANTTNEIPDLNANIAESSGFQLTGHAMSPGFQITEQPATSSVGGFQNMTKMESAFINHGVGLLDSNGNSMSFVQLLKDVQGDNVLVRNNFASPLFGSQSEANRINFGSQESFSGQFQPNQINFGSQSQQANAIVAPELKKRKRKPKEKPLPLPDLNGVCVESSVLHINLNQHTDKPTRKKRNKSAGVTINRIGKEGCVQLTPMNGFKPVTLPPGFGPPRGSAPPPDLVFIKQKLEMMKSTMEKAGNSLSPEMRGKLESEIHGFTMKVNSMFGSSSF